MEMHRINLNLALITTSGVFTIHLLLLLFTKILNFLF